MFYLFTHKTKLFSLTEADINTIIDKDNEMSNSLKLVIKEFKKLKKDFRRMDYKRLTRNLVSFKHNAFEVFGDNLTGKYLSLYLCLFSDC